jgi:hypothetical protein
VNISWYEITNPGKKRIPKWALTFGVDDSGQLYVPSVLAAAPMVVFLCASYDGTKAILDGEHAYYPADWVKREFPQTRKTIERIEDQLKEDHAE